MADAVEIVKSDTPMLAAGERLAEVLREAMHHSELVRLAIPGGSALAAASTAQAALGVEFERVQLTFVDERCVAVSDPESNRGAAERAGLFGPAHPPRRSVPLFVDGETPDDAVARARDELCAVFDSAIDVALLGLGEDGHVASLFPGRFDRDVDATVLRVDDSPKPPAGRITLGWRMLATAHTCIVAAAGEAKRRALERLCAGDPDLPATGLHGVVVFTDLDLRTAPPSTA